MALATFESDDEHIRRTRDLVGKGKAFLQKEIAGMGLQCVAGEGNFVMIKLPISDSLAYRKLMTHGVMIRSMTGFRFPNWIRITISHEEDMEAFVEALGKIMKDES